MHVALLTAAPVTAHGWGRYTRDLVSALAAQGVRITLITSREAPLDPDLPLTKYHRILPSLTPAPRFSTARLIASIPLVQRLIRICDVVHAIAEPYALAASFSAKPLAITAHGTYIPQTIARPATGSLYRRVYRRATIICVSSYTAKQVKAALSGAPIVVIPNGVNAARFREPPAALSERKGPIILAVGQVKPRKGYHLLVAAMPAIRAALPEAQAVIIGDTSADPVYADSIRAAAWAAGMPEAVRLLGRVPEDELRGWYHAADVFALPALNLGGRFEGFGLAYLEASAAGLPVIGTRDCGAEDAIREGETGVLIAQNDPEALSAAIIALLRDPARRARMGAAGAAHAAEHSWDKVARRMITIYEQMLSRR